LQDFKRKTYGRLSRAILADQQNRRAIRDWQLKILQAPEVVDVQSANHKQMILRCPPRSMGNILRTS
jgi:hypothetical protein